MMSDRPCLPWWFKENWTGGSNAGTSMTDAEKEEGKDALRWVFKDLFGVLKFDKSYLCKNIHMFFPHKI